MKPTLRNLHWLAILCLILTAACSEPSGNSNTTNTNAAPPAEAANANASPSVTPQPVPPTVSTVPAPAPQPASPPPVVAATPATAAPPATTNGPKLVVLTKEKDLDFGKQSQDKTLTRAILIRNGGKAVLNIESVVPS